MFKVGSSEPVGGAVGPGRPPGAAGSATSGELAAYVSQIRRYPLLTAARERELARAYRDANDRTAHALLVTSNLRFVLRIARRYRARGRRLADLVQEGNLGLLRAIERYDPDRNSRLVTYAAWWIRACIQAHILRTWSMVRLGTTRGQRRAFYGLARASGERRRRGDGVAGSLDPAGLAAVAGELGVAPGVVEEVSRRVLGGDVALDEPATDGRAPRVESLASGEPGPDEALQEGEERALLSQRIGAALSRLDPRERAVVQARLMGEAPLTFAEVGRLIGCSPERARHLERRAIGKLRASLATAAGEGGG